MPERLRDMISGLYWDAMMEQDEEMAYLHRKIARILEEPAILHPELDKDRLRYLYIIVRNDLDTSRFMEQDPQKKTVYQNIVSRLGKILMEWERSP